MIETRPNYNPTPTPAAKIPTEIELLTEAICCLEKTVETIEIRCSEIANPPSLVRAGTPTAANDIEAMSNIASSIQMVRLRVENCDLNLKSLLGRMDI